MSTFMSKFLPKVHGFHFPNKFDNVVFKEWFGSWTTHGLCGGMAFAALDYFYSGILIPNHTGDDFPNGKVPEDKSILRGYIYNRLMDSFLSNGIRFVGWSQKLDHYTWVYGDGVPQLTKNEEFPKLCECLKNGPVAIGLISTKSSIFTLGENHQVVAYGAELDEITGAMKVFIYDNNLPEYEVVLSSGPSDLHFFGNVTYTDGSIDEYRGFFVEDYTPKTPSYVDLAVIKPVANGILYSYLGDPLEVRYTVKNLGEYSSPLSSLSLSVKGPAGDSLNYFFGNDNINTPLQPGEEREYFKRCDNFGTTLGDYILKPGYISKQAIKFDNIPGGTETKLKIQYFSKQLLAEPPYVERVSIVKAIPGLKPGGFSKLDNGIIKYDAGWNYNPAGRRDLAYDARQFPITANRRLYLFIRFSTSNFIGTSVIPGTMKSVTVNLTGTMPDNSRRVYPIVMIQEKDDLGAYYWGSHRPENLTANYRLNLEISGIDAVQHYPKRNPIGDMLDSNPFTIASVDRNTPPMYPFLNYEPGIDKNHIIEISPIPQTLPVDAFEVNNDFTTAVKKSLGVPDASTGASLDLSNLTLHNEADVDYFSIDFQSLAGDDTCAMENPSTVSVSDKLGLSVTHYPPRLVIYINNLDDNDANVEIFKPDSGNRTLLTSSAGKRSIVINNPFKKLGEKKFYIAIKNPDFKTQGALSYELNVRYLPKQDVFTASGKPSYQEFDARRVFLDKLFDALDLPRPGDDLIIQSKTNSQIFEAAQKIGVISNNKVFASKLNKYLQSARTRKALQLVARGDYMEILKQGRENLSVISKKIVNRNVIVDEPVNVIEKDIKRIIL